MTLEGAIGEALAVLVVPPASDTDDDDAERLSA
jgi:hypothetical protein